jgi:hypothetical protein
MASAVRDYGFSPQESYATTASNWRKIPVPGPAPVDQERRSVDIGPYARIPNRFFGSGMGARLGSSAGYLYIALCDHANRNGSNTFKLSDKALAGDTAIATRTICDARR